MNPNRREGTTGAEVNPYGLGRNREAYYSFRDEENEDDALYPGGKSGAGKNAAVPYKYVPLGGDYSNETTQAAWLDKTGSVPVIDLGSKRYFLNQRNWNWLIREAASQDNRDMLKAGIRDVAGLHKYISSKYPCLIYMLRSEPTKDGESNLLPPIEEYDKYIEEAPNESAEIQLLPFIGEQGKRYEEVPLLPPSKEPITLPLSPEIHMHGDIETEYRARRPTIRSMSGV